MFHSISMRYKSAICILSLLCACGLPAAAWAAPAEYAVIELRCLDESVVYTDYPVRPTNHIVADEIAERRINGTLPEKAEQMDNCLSSAARTAMRSRTRFRGWRPP